MKTLVRTLAIGLMVTFGARAQDAAAPIPPPVLEAPAETPMTQPPENASVFVFGVQNPTCAAWTNACQICVRDAAGAPACSTPGIACTPGPVVCRSPAPVPPAETPASPPK